MELEEYAQLMIKLCAEEGSPWYEWCVYVGIAMTYADKLGVEIDETTYAV